MLVSPPHFSITLPAYAPLLQCLHFESEWQHPDVVQQVFSVNYPTIRILRLNGKLASAIDPQWWKDNLTHVESMTLSNGHCSMVSGVLRALSSISRRIPCLTVNLFPSTSLGIDGGSKIKAEKVILCYETAPLAMIDNHCKTIVLRQCRFPVEPKTIPCSSTLELDWCVGSHESINLEWDGDAVIVTNSNFSCIKAVLAHLGTTPTSSEGLGRFLWPNVTTLKLVAKDRFVMEFSMVKMLKDMVHSRLTRGDALQRNLKQEKDKELGSGMESKGIKPITILHVHGGPALSRHSRLWFRERVKDFVWDYKTS